MNPNQDGMKKEILWHSQNVASVFEYLNAKDSGLSKEEALTRLSENGPNTLTESKERSIIKIFFDQFKNPLIYVLILAAISVAFLGELTDSVIIFFVLFANAVIGAFQEGRARKTLNSLKQFIKGKALVIRDGMEFQIPDDEVVVGDIIILRDGDKVPADARLVSLQELKVNESSLTGESEPVEKDLELKKEEDPITERKNMIYKGTLCVSGEARAVVTACGVDTYVGSISEKLKNIETEMPLKSKVRILSKTIGWFIFAAVIFMFLVGFVRGIPIYQIFFTATAVAVSLIPEGLPVVITLILARGVYRMAKRNALIKNMQAVEALGQANVIAVDKTGTITKNELMVEKVYIDEKDFKVLGSGFANVGNILKEDRVIDPANHPELIFAGKIASFCANASVEFLENGEVRVIGDPTEAALLIFGEKVGFKKEELESEEPQVLQIPFNTKHKFHTTLHKSSLALILSIVGAPENVLSKVHSIWSTSGERPINEIDREKIDQKIREFSSSGLRVIAFAYHSGTESLIDIENLPPLVFCGLYAMADVLREEVREAVLLVEASGIKTVMITGDHLGTAEAIAREAGIFKEGDRVITGKDIEDLSAEELGRVLDDVSVFARVLPEHKLSIVEAYKLRGDVIGMTGDGVNDALSLEAAHLGIAMGKGGTEVAKEAADIVLLDNNFISIIAAIEEGRSIYATIKKVVLYLISTGLGEFFSIAGALLIGLPLPLFPSQILWLNLVTDGFLVVALGLESNVSLKEGATDTNIISRGAASRALVMGLVMMVGTLFVFSIFYKIGSPKVWTLSLTLLAVFQWLNAWNVRSEKKSVFYKPFSNPYLILGLLSTLFFHLLAVYHPFMQKILKTVPLSMSDWLLVVGVAFSIILVEEIRKIFSRHYNPIRA